MSHLGSRLSALVDGQLPPDQAERVLGHVAACAACAEELAAARTARGTLAGIAGVEPDPRLTARLLALGCAPPVHPHAAGPGTGSLPLPGSGAQQATLTGDLHRRRRRWPAVAGVAAGGVVVLCFQLGGEPTLPAHLLDGHPLGALQQAAVAASLRPAGPVTLEAEVDQWLAEHPWAVDADVPPGHELIAVRAEDDLLEVDLAGPDGLVVVQQWRGRLTETGEPVTVDGVQVRRLGADPTHVTWQSGDAVVAVLAEGPQWAVSPVLSAYPVQPYDDGATARVGRGFELLLTRWTG